MQNLLVAALILLSAGVTSSRAAVLPSQKQVLDTFHQVLNVSLFFEPRKIFGPGSEGRDWIEAEKKPI